MSSPFQTFRALHHDGMFVLPNAWDAMSAVVFERAGFLAVGTSSAAIAWSQGYPDGEAIPFDSMRTIVARMLEVLRVPLTVDFEAGYSDDIETIVEHATTLAEMGAAGINLEDADQETGTTLRSIEFQCALIERLRAKLASGNYELFINARTDVCWLKIGDGSDRLQQVVERANAYSKAGADGVFVPGLSELSDLREVVPQLNAPLNILAFQSDADSELRSALKEMGVARISVGSTPYRSMVTHIEALAANLKTGKNFTPLFEGAATYQALQSVFEADQK